MPITFVVAVLYVTFKVGKHSVGKVARELICVLVCCVRGAWRTAIQSHFVDTKLHYPPLLAEPTATNLILVMILKLEHSLQLYFVH